jgi:hypothetical protein
MSKVGVRPRKRIEGEGEMSNRTELDILKKLLDEFPTDFLKIMVQPVSVCLSSSIQFSMAISYSIQLSMHSVIDAVTV